MGVVLFLNSAYGMETLRMAAKIPSLSLVSVNKRYWERM